MLDFTNPRILTLDEAFEYLDEVHKEAILQENIERYVILLSNFINQYHDSDKIKNLKSNQYTVEARKSPKIFYLDIYINDRTPTTTLTDEQIKKLQELDEYLKTPEAIKIINYRNKLGHYIIIPFFICLVIIFLYFSIKIKIKS